MLECVSNILAHILWINGSFDAYMKRVFGDELALQRALDFTGSFVALGNVLGTTPKERISQWTTANDRVYQIRRSAPWDSELPATAAHSESGSHSETDTDQQFARDTKHSQIEVVSPIRMDLWEKAGWNATAFAVAPDPRMPPIIAPVFQDRASALEIFAAWRNEIGKEDPNEVIRLSLVKGISKAEPFSYCVSIGANAKADQRRKETRYFALVSRLNRMNPASSFNLSRFEKSVALSGRYYLAPAVYTGQNGEYELLPDNHLRSRVRVSSMGINPPRGSP